MTAEARVNALVTRRYGASPERVFDAWLDPGLVGRWMLGPSVRDEEVVRVTIDARVGGAFSFVVRRQGEEIDHFGQYLEIDRARRLVFTWNAGPVAKRAAAQPASADSARVIVEIAVLDRGCKLTLTHEMAPEWASFVPKAELSWATMLNSLARTIE